MSLPKRELEGKLDCGRGRRCKPLRARSQKVRASKHCVMTPKDKLVRCFFNKKTAKKVARGFGSEFYVQERG